MNEGDVVRLTHIRCDGKYEEDKGIEVGMIGKITEAGQMASIVKFKEREASMYNDTLEVIE